MRGFSPEAVVEGIFGGDHSDVDRSLFPDTIFRQKIIQLIHQLTKLLRPLEDVIHQAERHVLHGCTPVHQLLHSL